MSMIREFVKKLRDKAFMQTVDGVYKLLDEAADVIEELSIKLSKANTEQSTEYYNGGWIPIDFPPEEDDSYMVAWIPTDRIITNCRTKHFYAIFEYENNEWSVDVPEGYDNSKVAILAWRYLPEEYRIEV